jgi:ABC-type nickel/cobalt efflux system permease component RcnA
MLRTANMSYNKGTFEKIRGFRKFVMLRTAIASTCLVWKFSKLNQTYEKTKPKMLRTALAGKHLFVLLVCLCVCMCVQRHTHTHNTHNTHVHTYTRTHVHVHVHTHTHTHTYIYTCTYILWLWIYRELERASESEREHRRRELAPRTRVAVPK